MCVRVGHFFILAIRNRRQLEKSVNSLRRIRDGNSPWNQFYSLLNIDFRMTCRITVTRRRARATCLDMAEGRHDVHQCISGPNAIDSHFHQNEWAVAASLLDLVIQWAWAWRFAEGDARRCGDRWTLSWQYENSSLLRQSCFFRCGFCLQCSF